MNRDQRTLASVPRWLHAALAAALAAQLYSQSINRPHTPPAADLPPAPRPAALRLASLDEPEAGARLTMLYLQTYDLGGGNALPYRRLDYQRLAAWLASILALDPRSDYPLFSAARVYADVADPQRTRIMLEFIYDEFAQDPNRRWPWLAHAALVAKHRLQDLPLARRYAAAVDRQTSSREVPLWARQMEIFILEDMNELEAAKVLLGGLLESGKIRDPNEARFLEQRLADLEAKAARREPQR